MFLKVSSNINPPESSHPTLGFDMPFWWPQVHKGVCSQYFERNQLYE
jgi:hypothetical protein